MLYHTRAEIHKTESYVFLTRGMDDKFHLNRYVKQFLVDNLFKHMFIVTIEAHTTCLSPTSSQMPHYL